MPFFDIIARLLELAAGRSGRCATWDSAIDLLSPCHFGFDVLFGLRYITNCLGTGRNHHPGHAEQLRE